MRFLPGTAPLGCINAGRAGLRRVTSALADDDMLAMRAKSSGMYANWATNLRSEAGFM